MSIRPTILLLFWSTVCCQPQVEPANVLVGDLTFVRPEKWIWEAPSDHSNAVTRFVLPGQANEKSPADVRFYTSRRDTHSVVGIWKTYFPEAEQPGNMKMERKKLGKRTIDYFTMRGTYGAPSLKGGRPNHLFMGAVVPWGNQFIHIRVVGPEQAVEPEIGNFKKMIEHAVKEKESE